MRYVIFSLLSMTTFKLQGFEATGTTIHSRLIALYNFQRSESLSYFPRTDIPLNDTTLTDRFQTNSNTSTAKMATNDPIATSTAMMTTHAPKDQTISPSLAFCELGEQKIYI